VALTDWMKMTPDMKAAVVEACNLVGNGFDLGRGDDTTVIGSLRNGKLHIDRVEHLKNEQIVQAALDRIGQPKAVDLVLQPDGSYAPKR
jgi:hypothetical protein